MSAPIHVALAERSYDIHVGAGLIDRAGALIAPLIPGRRVVVVCDAAVAPLHLPRLEASLAAEGVRSHKLLVEAGEGSKSWRGLEQLIDQLLGLGIERGIGIVAFGGGVIGDLAGFAAAITLRGLPVVQVPTTLLAQVDSAIGGKTGINTAAGKNLVGAFHQPRLVVADVGLLATLPPRELRAGYAEVVKYALIDRPDFFAWLEREGPALLGGALERLEHAVRVSAGAKAAIVAADERETSGQRALLNLGHTFGHAYEAAAGYSGSLLHGEAVAIGLVHAFALSARLGLLPAATADRVRRHLSEVGLPTDLNGRNFALPQLLDAMTRDKKVQDGRVTFILARDIGQSFVARDIALADAAAVMREAGAI